MPYVPATANVPTPTPRQRPPVPVIIAVGMLGLTAAGALALAAVNAANNTWSMAAAAIVGAVIVGGLAFGLWRGERTSRAVAVVFVGISIAVGLAGVFSEQPALSLFRAVWSATVLVLILIPPSSNAYFRRPTPAAMYRR